MGGWREVIDPGALDGAELDDLIATREHDRSKLLGRHPTTLEVEDRDDGLHWAVELPDSPVGEDVRVAVERGDLRATSWRMVVARDYWDGDVRHVAEIARAARRDRDRRARVRRRRGRAPQSTRPGRRPGGHHGRDGREQQDPRRATGRPPRRTTRRWTARRDVEHRRPAGRGPRHRHQRARAGSPTSSAPRASRARRPRSRSAGVRGPRGHLDGLASTTSTRRTARPAAARRRPALGLAGVPARQRRRRRDQRRRVHPDRPDAARPPRTWSARSTP